MSIINRDIDDDGNEIKTISARWLLFFVIVGIQLIGFIIWLIVYLVRGE
jgi:preprotein translocase subunit Sss1